MPPERMAAVLDRDPESLAWLHAHLSGRRDAASAALAFEFAGRLQEEIEALDWVTAEQKVTRAAPSSLEVHGWARRRCDAASASTRVGRTPSEWAAFVRRNAELAARLAG